MSMSDPIVPNAELLNSLGRLVRGLSALFWGLPLTLVVSVQTAAVHGSGALGKACVALLPHAAEWRYMAHGDQMPWYGSVRLLRQPAPGVWDPVIEDAALRLAPMPVSSEDCRADFTRSSGRCSF